MKFAIVLSAILLSVVSEAAAAQGNAALANNAALRYWSAFSQMQDTAITDQQVKELNAILDGTTPYVDPNYKDLLDKNKRALETMRRGTALPGCDWGLDYALGIETPVEYARKGLTLGRINVLFALHSLLLRDQASAARALTAGMRFADDIGNGGSFLPTLIAKNLLVVHLRTLTQALATGQFAATQLPLLRDAVNRLGSDPLDWKAAARLDLEALRNRFARDAQASAALTRIISAYVEAWTTLRAHHWLMTPSSPVRRPWLV